MDELVDTCGEAVFSRFRVEEADLPGVSWPEHAKHAVYHEVYLDVVRTVLAAISSSTTHRVVPAEPTEEMVDVLKAPIYGAVDMKSIQRSRESGLSLYAKLLAASPKVPA